MARDWNSAYEAGDTPWDKGYAAPPLSEFLKLLASGKVERSLTPRHCYGGTSLTSRRVEGKVLVPGCGTGHDVRLLAGQGAEVLGLDIAPNAMKQASLFPVSGQETYALGNFLNLEKKYHGQFDWVVEHTCFCAIEPSERIAYTSSLKQALKPGGYYLAVFFLEVSDYDGEGPPHPVSREEIDALFANDFNCIHVFTPQQSYPSRPPGTEEVRWMQIK